MQAQGTVLKVLTELKNSSLNGTFIACYALPAHSVG